MVPKALAVLERTREIGLMRAIGMTRRQTRSLIRLEAGPVLDRHT